MAATAGLACSLASMADMHSDNASPSAPAVATVTAGPPLQAEGSAAELPAAGDNMGAPPEPAPKPAPEAGPATDAPEAAAAAIEPERHAEASAVEQAEQPRPVVLTWAAVEKR